MNQEMINQNEDHFVFKIEIGIKNDPINDRFIYDLNIRCYSGIYDVGFIEELGNNIRTNKERKLIFMDKIMCPHCGKEIDLKDMLMAEKLDLLLDNKDELVLDYKNKILEKDMKIQELEGLIKLNESNYKCEELKNKQKYEDALKLKDEEIEKYKDYKIRLSTKMVGESLEKFCSNKFDEIRSLAFPKAYFEKDNELSDESKSKGDFIFKDYEDGIEYISIMFEMKNETETDGRKHKNDDFLKELDKDRREKGCEYAVLVSMLEPDNDLYNGGIVDKSHIYPKTYVIRPQFFISLLTMLTNAAKNTVIYKKEVEEMKKKEIDVINFENKLNDFKSAFSKNALKSFDAYESAIKDIDKTIKNLESVKADLEKSGKNLRIANNKLMDVSIKKLTRGNETMKEKFSEAIENDTNIDDEYR